MYTFIAVIDSIWRNLRQPHEIKGNHIVGVFFQSFLNVIIAKKNELLHLSNQIATNAISYIMFNSGIYDLIMVSDKTIHDSKQND